MVLDAGMLVQRVRLVGFLVSGFESGWRCFLGNVGVLSVLLVALEIRFDTTWTVRMLHSTLYATPRSGFVIIDPVCRLIGYYLRSVECCVSVKKRGPGEVIED